MIHHNTDPTFRGLPLTAEQDSEIRHYLNRRAAGQAMEYARTPRDA